MAESNLARLRGTTRIYRVVELFHTCAGFSNGEPVLEEYARCETIDGKPATWKRGQLVKAPQQE